MGWHSLTEFYPRALVSRTFSEMPIRRTSCSCVYNNLPRSGLACGYCKISAIPFSNNVSTTSLVQIMSARLASGQNSFRAPTRFTASRSRARPKDQLRRHLPRQRLPKTRFCLLDGGQFHQRSEKTIRDPSLFPVYFPDNIFPYTLR